MLELRHLTVGQKFVFVSDVNDGDEPVYLYGVKERHEGGMKIIVIANFKDILVNCEDELMKEKVVLINL